jgi:uncharacterized protein (DUF302 family)
MKTKLFLLLALFFAGISTTVNAKDYYFSKTVKGSYEEVIQKTKDVLKEEGFGVLTEIPMDEKIKDKVDGVEMKPYTILGVCNPGYAYKAYQLEENIGLFLPCKVLVKKISDKKSEVVFIDSSVIFKSTKNHELDEVASKVTEHFKSAMEKL